MLNKQHKQAAYSRYLKKLQSSNNNIINDSKQLKKPKQVISQIVKQIDQIKEKLSSFSDYTSIDIYTRPHSELLSKKTLQTENQFQFEPIYQHQKSKNFYQSNSRKKKYKKKQEISNSMVKRSRQSKGKKIKQSQHNLQEINENLIRQNQKLYRKLFSEKSQKKYLKKLLESFNCADSLKYSAVTTQQNLFKKNQPKSTSFNHNNYLNQNPIQHKICEQKQKYTDNKTFYSNKASQQSSMNGSFRTEKKIKNNIIINDKNYYQYDFTNSTQQSYLKQHQLNQMTFKQQYFQQKQKSDSMIFDYVEPVFGSILNNMNVNIKTPSKNKSTKQDQCNLKILQDKFNDLICLSRFQKDAEKKASIRKQLVEVANYINMIKKKLQIK